MARAVVITGPSGVGKGTLIRLLRERMPELQLSVSATTRLPRPRSSSRAFRRRGRASAAGILHTDKGSSTLFAPFFPEFGWTSSRA